MSRVPSSLREAVRHRARDHCEYCRTPVSASGQEFTVDHVIPRSQGGSDDLGNLSYCCFWCNSYKQATTEAADPRTKRAVRLFNPRVDNWDDHFRWSPTSTRVIGRSATGRATVEALRLNRQSLLRSRKLWAVLGLHPPAR